MELIALGLCNQSHSTGIYLSMDKGAIRKNRMNKAAKNAETTDTHMHA